MELARISRRSGAKMSSRQSIKLKGEHCQYIDFATASPDVEIESQENQKVSLANHYYTYTIEELG